MSENVLLTGKDLKKETTYNRITSKNVNVKKSNLHYTPGITPTRVPSGGAHLRGLAPGQHCFEETSQRWRGVGSTLSDLTDPGIEPQIFRSHSNVRDN